MKNEKVFNKILNEFGGRPGAAKNDPHDLCLQYIQMVNDDIKVSSRDYGLRAMRALLTQFKELDSAQQESVIDFIEQIRPKGQRW